jgi:TM2 domain-containing membrane protein YozV
MGPNTEPVIDPTVEPVANPNPEVSIVSTPYSVIVNPDVVINEDPNTTAVETPVAVPVVAPVAVSVVEPEINLLTGKVVDPSKQRHFLAAFFLSFIFGVFGIDRFYLGKYWTGILKLLTFGGMGVWALIDLNIIMSGGMRDKQGNKLLQADRYKKFATRTMWIFSLAVTAILVLLFATTAYVVMHLMQNGGLDKLVQMMQGGTGMENLIPNGAGGSQTINVNQVQSLLNGS